MDLPQQQCKPVTLRESTRLEDLHHKLNHAQRELNKLRDQLASAEVAKVDAEEALEKAKKQVFSAMPELKSEGGTLNSPPTAAASEPVKATGSLQEQDAHNEAAAKINGGKITGKEKEVEVLLEEGMARQNSAPDAQANEAKLKAKMASMEAKLKSNSARTAELTEQLAAAERARSALELEMKRLRVQTEQWRKAAEVATALLAAADGDVTVQGGRRVRATERHRSMDKYSWWGSPLSDGGADQAVDSGARWNAARTRGLETCGRRKCSASESKRKLGGNELFSSPLGLRHFFCLPTWLC